MNKYFHDNLFYQKTLILIALATKVMKNYKKKIALILGARYQESWRYCPKLNMANFYVNCIDSHSIVRLRQYLQGKKCADMGSYFTEWYCLIVWVQHNVMFLPLPSLDIAVAKTFKMSSWKEPLFFLENNMCIA